MYGARASPPAAFPHRVHVTAVTRRPYHRAPSERSTLRAAW
jgi:hypothetical protein